MPAQTETTEDNIHAGDSADLLTDMPRELLEHILSFSNKNEGTAFATAAYMACVASCFSLGRSLLSTRLNTNKFEEYLQGQPAGYAINLGSINISEVVFSGLNNYGGARSARDLAMCLEFPRGYQLTTEQVQWLCQQGRTEIDGANLSSVDWKNIRVGIPFPPAGEAGRPLLNEEKLPIQLLEKPLLTRIREQRMDLRQVRTTFITKREEAGVFLSNPRGRDIKVTSLFLQNCILETNQVLEFLQAQLALRRTYLSLAGINLSFVKFNHAHFTQVFTYKTEDWMRKEPVYLNIFGATLGDTQFKYFINFDEKNDGEKDESLITIVNDFSNCDLTSVKNPHESLDRLSDKELRNLYFGGARLSEELKEYLVKKGINPREEGNERTQAEGATLSHASEEIWDGFSEFRQSTQFQANRVITIFTEVMNIKQPVADELRVEVCRILSCIGPLPSHSNLMECFNYLYDNLRPWDDYSLSKGRRLRPNQFLDKFRKGVAEMRRHPNPFNPGITYAWLPSTSTDITTIYTDIMLNTPPKGLALLTLTTPSNRDAILMRHKPEEIADCLHLLAACSELQVLTFDAFAFVEATIFILAACLSLRKSALKELCFSNNTNLEELPMELLYCSVNLKTLSFVQVNMGRYDQPTRERPPHEEPWGKLITNGSWLSKLALLKQNKLTTLRFICCNIQDCGLRHIANMLQSNNSLQHLFLDENPIDTEHVFILLKALINKATQLRLLSLGNGGMMMPDLSCLSEMRGKNETLTVLVLSGNNIADTEDNGRAVGHILQCFPRLKKLDLNNNSLSFHKSMNALSKELSAHESLETLDLSGNPLSDECFSKLADVLEKNGSLKFINLYRDPNNSFFSRFTRYLSLRKLAKVVAIIEFKQQRKITVVLNDNDRKIFHDEHKKQFDACADPKNIFGLFRLAPCFIHPRTAPPPPSSEPKQTPLSRR